jgi:hypothetical protein
LAIETFFTAIKDGVWHELNELSTQLDIPLIKLIELSKFLSNNNLIEYEENKQMIKLNPLWESLLPIGEDPKTKLTKSIQ